MKLQFFVYLVVVMKEICGHTGWLQKRLNEWISIAREVAWMCEPMRWWEVDFVTLGQDKLFAGLNQESRTAFWLLLTIQM